MEEGEKRMDEKVIKNVEKVAAEVGWLEKIKIEWKIQTKKAMWKDIHHDIVST